MGNPYRGYSTIAVAFLTEQGEVDKDPAAQKSRILTRRFSSEIGDFREIAEGLLRRRLGARDPIEVYDQAPEQGDELPGLLVREAPQRLAVALEQSGDRVW
jgi:hypothetical protein